VFQKSTMSLDTPLSLYLKLTYDQPLPARFYDPKTGEPIQATPLIAVFERAEGNLSADDIAAAYILANVPTTQGGSPKRNLTPIIETMKAYGAELSTRFGFETKYSTYSVAQLEADRAIWEGRLRAEKDYERLLSDGISTAYAKMLEFPVSPMTKPEVQQSNLVFTRVSWHANRIDMNKIRDRDTKIQPIIDKTRLTNEDAPDIFALIPVTGDIGGIPYLGFHTPTSNQYRVATTPAVATCSTKVCAIHPDKDEYTYKIIRNSDLYNDLRGSTAFLSFMFQGLFCLLDLTHSTLILNRVHKDSEDAFTAQIIDLLPFLRIEGLAHHRITARIVAPMGGAIAYHVLFFDAMLNQADYIGFKEEEDPQLLKPTRAFYLSPIPRVVNPLTDEFAFTREIHVVVANRVSANSELVSLERGGAPHELTRGSAYVEFMVYDVSDADLLKFTVAYLSRMVGHYFEVAAIQYAPFIAEEFKLPVTLASMDSSTDAVYSRTNTNIRGIDFISHTYPEVFGHNFTRQCPHYPTVKQHLDPDDVEYHPQQGGTTDSGGANEWLRYPPDGGIEFYFRCGVEDPNFPNPGLVVSKLRNRVKYPLLPCCFRSNQFRGGHHTEVAYRLGSARASAVSAIDIAVASWGTLNFPPSFNRRLLMASEKTLHRGRLGRIPEALTFIMRSHILPTEEEEDDRLLVRYGLSETNMIHAAYLAIDKNYQKLSTKTAPERLAYLKKHIGANLPEPACLYQELQANQATREELMKFENWSTTTHYRILEEILDINLYVIIRVAPRENLPEPNRYFFEIPTTRSGAPHMRRHSSTRPSVILYRIRRFEGDFVVDSGVELLMFGDQDNNFSAVWGTGSSTRIAELYTRAAQVVSFGISPINSAMYNACVGLNTADYAATLRTQRCQPISQLIDERGLCRALTFEELGHSGDSHPPILFSLVFPATQPYNLPFSSTLKTIRYEPNIRRIFGEACMTSMVRDGVFYLLGDDPTRYVFVPLIENDDTLPTEMPKTPYTPLTGLGANAVGFATQWRSANTYLTVLLFMVSFLYAFAEPRDPQVFLENHMTIDESRHAAHASDIYELSGLKRILLLREPTMTDALATIKRLAPSLLDETGQKLVVTSQKIYDGFAYFVRTVHSQTVATPLPVLRKKRWDLAEVVASVRDGGGSITNLLTKASGEKISSTLNFGSSAAVRTWFRGMRSGATSGGMALAPDVRSVIETVRSGTGAVLWRHPSTQRLWLIPAMTLSLRKAAIVCYLWSIRHRVIEADSQKVAEGLLVQSGKQKSRLTAIFHQRTLISGKRSRSRGAHLLVAGSEIDDDTSQFKNQFDSGEISVKKYVLTRDNRIELLAAPADQKVRFVVEVLRTAPTGYTPMLSP
jgi:hypothetical protein